MQKIIVVGNIGADAEVRDLGNVQVINFNLAVTEKVKEEKVTTWYKCAYFTNNVAVAPYLTKGSIIGVEGKPELETYTNNEGNTIANLKCIVRDVRIYKSTYQQSEAQNNQANQQPTSSPFPQANSSNEEEQDDLPF